MKTDTGTTIKKYRDTENNSQTCQKNKRGRKGDGERSFVSINLTLKED